MAREPGGTSAGDARVHDRKSELRGYDQYRSQRYRGRQLRRVRTDYRATRLGHEGASGRAVVLDDEERSQHAVERGRFRRAAVLFGDASGGPLGAANDVRDTTASNINSSGTGAWWFLIDAARALRPFIFQLRREYKRSQCPRSVNQEPPGSR